MDRDALYYPYTEIRDAAWLKSALLCFPQVRCLVPSGHRIRNRPWIKEFYETKGANGPLVCDETPNSAAARIEQRSLATKIDNAADEYKRRFSLKAAQRDFPEHWNDYRIIPAKMADPLADVLHTHRLVWLADDAYAVHPRLGRAIMATIAIATANSKGLDIVTDKKLLHRSVITQRQEDVFTELAGTPPTQPSNIDGEIGDELAQVFMTTCIDASKLSASDIAKLQRDGFDLREFKREISKIAKQLPDIIDAKERNVRLESAAKDVLKKWESYRKSLQRCGLDSIFSAAELKLPTSASAILAGVAAGELPIWTASGLAVGVAVYGGSRIWNGLQEKKKHPFYYLNRINAAGASLKASTTIQRKGG